MSAFTIYLMGKNVSKYTDMESFDGFDSRVEGDGIWDFMVDSLSFELDRSIMDYWDYKPIEVEVLIHKKVELKYYGKTVFRGVVEEVAYNYESETLAIIAASMARVVSQIPIETFYGTHEDLALMVWWLLTLINIWLIENNYPYTINPKASLNVVDFPFFRSINGREITGISFGSGKDSGDNSMPEYITEDNLIGVVEKYSGLTPMRNFYLYFYVQSTSYPNHHYYLVPLSASGPDYANIITTEDLYYYPHGHYRPANDSLDNGIMRFLKEKIFPEQPYTVKTAAQIDDAIFIVAKVLDTNHYIQITIEQTDRFAFKYEDTTAGDILRDMAIMTNSMVWLSTGNKLYFQNREGRSWVAPVEPQSMEIQTVNHTEAFNPPDAFIILDDVKNDLIDYYNDYLKGRFKRYKLMFDHTEFSMDNDWPMQLKKMVINNRLNVGIIRAVSYKEDVVEVETEVRIG